MSDKKDLIKIVLCLILMLLAIYLIYNHYEYKVVKVAEKPQGIIKENKNRKIISKYKTKYNNDEVVMLLEIPNVLEVPIVQTDDNKFYYTHDLYKDYKESGTPFLDYRNKSIRDKKLIIYDQKSNGEDSLLSIENYKNQSYYEMHPIIKVITEEKERTFKIFSSYVEQSDFDYTNFNSYNGLTYLEHINKLKSKSLYDTGVILEDDSKIIILDLSSNDNDIKKDMLVIGVELKKEELPDIK